MMKSRGTTISFQPPLSQVRQFLGLADDQVSTILQNNQAYNEFSFQQQEQIRQAQSQIAVETAKDPLDPMTIGNLYANIETTCRALRDKAATVQLQNGTTRELEQHYRRGYSQANSRCVFRPLP